MVESGRVPGKGRIRENTKKLFERVSEKGRICAIIEKLSGRVSEKGRIIVSTGKW